MLLQALVRYYETLAETGEAPLSGFSYAGVSFALQINEDGELKGVLSCKELKGKKLVSRNMVVPEQVKKSNGIVSNFLCDNSSYVLGFDDKGKPERALECFAAFRKLHFFVLKDAECREANAVLRFLDRWDPGNAAGNEMFTEQMDDILKGGLFVFLLDGVSYIHESPEIKKAWLRYLEREQEGIRMQCLVTGEETVIARLHPSVKGLHKGQSMGNTLISFNAGAYESYNRNGGQGLNSPVGKYAAFAYGTALNLLLADSDHRMVLGDTTIVFWTDSSDKRYQDMVSLFLNVSEIERENEGGREESAVREVKHIFSNLSEGMPVVLPENEENITIYILGLSPNAARISVRFFWRNSFGAFVRAVMRHYMDLQIVRQFENEKQVIPIWKILSETVSPNSSDKMSSPLLTASVMNAVLSGTPYPQALYQNILLRSKTERNINYYKAAVIKACLLRMARYRGTEEKEEVLQMSLNEISGDKAYVLGRLFAVLEKAQTEANPGLNVTIKDRYFSSACSTPGAVFPQLLRLSIYHTSKAEYGHMMEKQKMELLDKLEVEALPFPKTLTLEEQGKFELGYYQQRKSLYTKKEKGENANG